MSGIITSVRRAEQGFFPLDKQWQLNETVYSDELGKQMVWLSGLLTYKDAARVLKRIGGHFIPTSSVWRQTQRHGSRLQNHVQRQQEQVSVERVVLPDAHHDHDQRKAVSMDGGMVNIRGEGWRELKVGVVFDVESRLERNPQTQELDEMAHGTNIHYTAVLGSKEEFTPALWALAVQQQVPTAKDRAVVADGALWIWNVAEDVCPDGRQIVDWFHAVQHLALAAAALYPDEHESKNRAQWLTTHKDHLYMGRIQLIIAALHQRQRDDLATYFERHQRRMQYLEFREEGFPIGSGTVESGVKQFKQRLTGTGMRWNPLNAQHMLVIRAAALSDDFDRLWDAA